MKAMVRNLKNKVNILQNLIDSMSREARNHGHSVTPHQDLLEVFTGLLNQGADNFEEPDESWFEDGMAPNVQVQQNTLPSKPKAPKFNFPSVEGAEEFDAPPQVTQTHRIPRMNSIPEGQKPKSMPSVKGQGEPVEFAPPPPSGRPNPFKNSNRR